MKAAALTGSPIWEIVLTTVLPDAIVPIAAWHDGVRTIMGPPGA